MSATTTPTKRAQKEANSRFYRLMDRTDFHVRVPNTQGLGVFVIGQAADLHGPQGKCKCCPRGDA